MFVPRGAAMGRATWRVAVAQLAALCTYRLPSLEHDRRYRGLAAEVSRSSYAPVVHIQVARTGLRFVDTQASKGEHQYVWRIVRV